MSQHTGGLATGQVEHMSLASMSNECADRKLSFCGVVWTLFSSGQSLLEKISTLVKVFYKRPILFCLAGQAPHRKEFRRKKLETF